MYDWFSLHSRQFHIYKIFLEPCLDVNHNKVEHGEISIVNCVNCTCKDGALQCVTLVCPVLSCPPEAQIQETNQCCKFCPGDKIIKKNSLNTTFRWQKINFHFKTYNKSMKIEQTKKNEMNEK